MTTEDATAEAELYVGALREITGPARRVISFKFGEQDEDMCALLAEQPEPTDDRCYWLLGRPNDRAPICGMRTPNRLHDVAVWACADEILTDALDEYGEKLHDVGEVRSKGDANGKQ